MKSNEFYPELDQLNKDGTNMWMAAPKLHSKHPQIPLLYCNKIVLEWIEERKYNVNY